MAKIANSDEAKLKQILGTALTEAVPFLSGPSSKYLLDRLVTDILKLGARHLANEIHRDRVDDRPHWQKEKSVGESYAASEIEVLTTYLDSVPNVTGSLSAVDKDRLDNVLLHGLGVSNIQLSEPDLRYVVRRFRDAITMYAGLAKVSSRHAKQIFDDRVAAMLDIVRAKLRQRSNEEAYKALSLEIVSALETAELRRSPTQLENIAEQIIQLAQDYVTGPEETRDEVYRNGEYRILISAFDPHSLPKKLGRAT